MRELKKLFYNPPKGGNERGAPTASSMSPLPRAAGEVDQTTLQRTFQAGVRGSNANRIHSGDVGLAEFRNFARGQHDMGDEDQYQAYDFECEREGNGLAQAVDPPPEGYRRVEPVLNPDTSLPYRTDGKPNHPMPKRRG